MKRFGIWGSFIAYWITYAYKLYPETNILKNGYILLRPEVELSIEGHVYYLGERARWVILACVIWYYMPHYKRITGAITIFHIGKLIDYELYFGGTYFTFMFFENIIPISYTVIMGIFITASLIYSYATDPES